ncbi:component of IIS longevity pathway SMK-1-domain-containing protein [Gautieria morchelliformis]|nr:component of IIS longevity pathway SMK-1-domain-containing protein [Gautieria morchelliformis]
MTLKQTYVASRYDRCSHLRVSPNNDHVHPEVYELIGQKWTDRGTAFCQGDYDEEARQARLIARAEHSNEILLQCIIRTSDVYQRQQDTLIVWTEPDGTDYALSFQDIEGCGEVWEFIGEVQRHLQDKAEEEAGTSETVGSSSMHTFPAGTMHPLSIGPKLPMPALGNMHDCERVIKQINRQPHGKEKLFDLLMANDYVKHLIDVMKQAEDLEDIKELHACCSCMQTILLVNDHNLYEYILQDPVFLGVIGVLEYDPEFPAHKASYRQFLETSGRFRQPIPIRDSLIRNKIHQTYRLQFLKDFILARATDDATFNVLNSCVIFNQIDIVNGVQQDERFLRELVGLFLTAEKGGDGKDKETAKQNERGWARGSSKGKERAKDEPGEETRPNGDLLTYSASPHSPAIDDRRKDTILLIQQLCLMGKNVQLPVRLQLFRTLVDRGVLHAIQWALGRAEALMVSTAGEVLGLLLDHDVNGVRQHVMRQVGIAGKPTLGVSVGVAGQVGDATSAEGNRETLLETLCRSLTSSHELAYKSQMADALRAVLEVPQSDGTESNTTTMRAMARTKDDPVTERFLEYFYGKCCENLFRPMAELPEHQKLTEPTLRLSRERSNLYLYLCDLLASFILQHSFRSLFFLVSNSSITQSLVPRIASLLRAREKHLRLAALRFFRACLKLGNRNLFLHLIKHDAIFPILELTQREAKWDNLLSSCCQEFFEHIRKENIKELLTHLMTKYEAKVQELAQSPVCGERFHNLIRRWEMNTEPPPKETETAQRYWGQGRLLEAEEEDYFNNSDDEEPPKSSPWPPLSPLGSVNTLKRKRGKGFTAGPPLKQSRPPSVAKSRPTQSLVDYDEDDDSEGSGGASSSKISDPVAGTPGLPVLSPPRQIDWFSETQVLDDPVPSKSAQNASQSGNHLDNGPPSHRLIRSDSPPRLGEKRRRSDDEDEDEMLERLVKSKKPSKKPSLGMSLEKEDSKSASPKSATPGKMKLKLGATSFSMTPASAGGIPPEKAKKDVDSG